MARTINNYFDGLRGVIPKIGQETLGEMVGNPDASLGLGLCQEPPVPMIASASFGPQLWRL